MIDTQTIFNFVDIEIDSESGTIKATWTVGSNIPYFDGHFPKNPILPAIAYLDLCSELFNQSGNKGMKLEFIKSAKFLEAVVPNDTLAINLFPNTSPHVWTCHIRNQKNNFVCKLLVTLSK